MNFLMHSFVGYVENYNKAGCFFPPPSFEDLIHLKKKERFLLESIL